MENTISHDLIENRTVYPIMKADKDKTMTVTATEFKKNLGKYLEMVAKEDIVITKNGNIIAVLKSPSEIAERIAWLDSIVGIANPEGKQYTDEELKEMRFEYLVEKYENLG